MPDFNIQHPLDISSTTEDMPRYPHLEVAGNYSMAAKSDRWKLQPGDPSVRTLLSLSAHPPLLPLLHHSCVDTICSLGRFT